MFRMQFRFPRRQTGDDAGEWFCVIIAVSVATETRDMINQFVRGEEGLETHIIILQDQLQVILSSSSFRMTVMSRVWGWHTWHWCLHTSHWEICSANHYWQVTGTGPPVCGRWWWWWWHPAEMVTWWSHRPRHLRCHCPPSEPALSAARPGPGCPAQPQYSVQPEMSTGLSVIHQAPDLVTSPLATFNSEIWKIRNLKEKLRTHPNCLLSRARLLLWPRKPRRRLSFASG